MTNYIKIFLEAEQVFDDTFNENSLSPQVLKLLMLCSIHFPKDHDFISVSGLKKLELFSKTCNFPRILQELRKAELLTAYPGNKKILYRISNKGKKLLHTFNFSLMELLD
jgi:hypothetical protein